MITRCSHFNQAIPSLTTASVCSPKAAQKQRHVETCSTNPATCWSAAQSAFPLCPAIYLPLRFALRGDESRGKGCYSTFNLPTNAATQRCTVHTLTRSTVVNEVLGPFKVSTRDSNNVEWLLHSNIYSWKMSVWGNVLPYLCSREENWLLVKIYWFRVSNLFELWTFKSLK